MKGLAKLQMTRELLILFALLAAVLIAGVSILFTGRARYQKRYDLCYGSIEILQEIPNMADYVVPVAEDKVNAGEVIDLRIEEDLLTVLLRFHTADWEMLISALPEQESAAMQVLWLEFGGQDE